MAEGNAIQAAKEERRKLIAEQQSKLTDAEKVGQTLEGRVVELINWRQFAEDIETIKPEQRVNAYLRLLEFAVGKKQSVSNESGTAVKDTAELIVEKMLGAFKSQN